MLEFILARYNYWIVICLMMTGLYIVFSRGNLVKTLIGLNLFQTSVFIFYITIGKVIGGTAPILIENKSSDKKQGAEHHDADFTHSAHAQHSEGGLSDAPVGMFNEATGQAVPSAAEVDRGAEAGAPYGAEAGDTLGTHGGVEPGVYGEASDLMSAAAGHASEAPSAASGLTGPSLSTPEILYSNPLPHVLILTAIVVGVATTSVGLALAVRIREAYGTVEQDSLEEMDNAEGAVEAGT
ncbi:MAG: cation:proton antiporter subunit C [Pseudomonadota bacterium]